MLKLHFAPNSRASRTMWLLEELGLEYELNRMDFHPKDLKSDEHRARHPLGRVPVLEDGGMNRLHLLVGQRLVFQRLDPALLAFDRLSFFQALAPCGTRSMLLVLRHGERVRIARYGFVRSSR